MVLIVFLFRFGLKIVVDMVFIGLDCFLFFGVVVNKIRFLFVVLMVKCLLLIIKIVVLMDMVKIFYNKLF